jgi:hypothetical protein
MMMRHDELVGTHDSHDGQGMTIQDMLDLLHSIPHQARHNHLMVCGPDDVSRDVAGIAFAQSDQAEKWDFKVYIVTMEQKG